MPSMPRPPTSSRIHGDDLVSLPKTRLTAFIGRLSAAKIRALDLALVAALDIDLNSLMS